MAADIKMREEIMDKLAEEVKEAVGVECTVHFRKVKKNNGMVLQGIVIREQGAKISPSIYIDGMLDKIEAGESSLQDVAREIADIYREGRYMPEVQDVVSSISRKYILERVVYQVVNKGKNAERLEKIPYRELMDLAAIYRVVVDSTGRNASFIVNRALCDKFYITEDELDANARRNTEMMGFSVRTIEAVLDELIGLPEGSQDIGVGMWVISNAAGFNGAAAMLYNSCFDRLAEQLGDDLYVLPSSIHEVIAVPVGEIKPDDLRNIVCSINASEVAEDDVLSDNVYRYCRRDGVLSIV